MFLLNFVELSFCHFVIHIIPIITLLRDPDARSRVSIPFLGVGSIGYDRLFRIYWVVEDSLPKNHLRTAGWSCSVCMLPKPSSGKVLQPVKGKGEFFKQDENKSGP